MNGDKHQPKHLLTINTMNNEQQNNDELVTPVTEREPYSLGKSDYNGFVNIEKNGKILFMIPFGKELHEHKTEAEAKKAAEAERDRLNAKHRGSGQIAQPRRVVYQSVGIVNGQFSKPSPEFLSVAEKRRFLANVFRSPEFTDADKFKTLQEDNRMLAMGCLENGKEQK